jgi:hypothetical protein
MKNIVLIALLCTSFSYCFSQIQVESNGRVQVGDNSTAANRTLEITTTGPTSRLRIKNQTTSPNGGIEFYGNGNAASEFKGGFLYYDPTEVMSFYGPAGLNEAIGIASTGGFTFRNGSNGLLLGQFTPTGTITVAEDGIKPGGGPWAGTSDIRSKKSVEIYAKGLDEIMQIEPVTYLYNGKFGTPDNGKIYTGVIAQELQEVVPSMVSKKIHVESSIIPNALETSNEVSSRKSKKVVKEEYLSVDPNEFVYMLINAVQEQQEQIQVLNKNIRQLRKDLVLNNITNIEIKDVPSETLEVTKATLSQNKPNPTSDLTYIDYFIPANVQDAEITFNNIAGQLIKKQELTKLGKGKISLDTSMLSSGVYTYQLFTDGILVDSKKIVVNK